MSYKINALGNGELERRRSNGRSGSQPSHYKLSARAVRCNRPLTWSGWWKLFGPFCDTKSGWVFTILLRAHLTQTYFYPSFHQLITFYIRNRLFHEILSDRPSTKIMANSSLPHAMRKSNHALPTEKESFKLFGNKFSVRYLNGWNFKWLGFNNVPPPWYVITICNTTGSISRIYLRRNALLCYQLVDVQ